MKRGSRALLALVPCALMLAACASQPDRFYTLSVLPQGSSGPRPAITTVVFLGVSLPTVADRREMVLGEPGDEVTILEHERWAAPVPDLITQTLGLDIERRRPDVLVAAHADRSSGLVKIRVDIVQLSARMTGNVTLEAHWRILDDRSSGDVIGAETFTAPVEGASYSGVARALSAALSSLADRLVASLPAH
jgi:uncharacterized protein